MYCTVLWRYCIRRGQAGRVVVLVMVLRELVIYSPSIAKQRLHLIRSSIIEQTTKTKIAKQHQLGSPPVHLFCSHSRTTNHVIRSGNHVALDPSHGPGIRSSLHAHLRTFPATMQVVLARHANVHVHPQRCADPRNCRVTSYHTTQPAQSDQHQASRTFKPPAFSDPEGEAHTVLAQKSAHAIVWA